MSTSTASARPSACILCSINCGIRVTTEGRRMTRTIGDKAHPSSAGYVCEKAQRLDHYQNGADRLRTPMRRLPDGSYEAVDWDTAVREVAAGLQKVKADHGGESILYYGGGGQGNHLGGAYGDALLKSLGVKYKSNALAQEKTGEFWVHGKMFGTGAHGDFEHCEVAMFIGKNPWQSHGFSRARAVIREINKDPARSMIVIDPRRSETAEQADFHLQLLPGTDAWLLAALVAILVQDDLVDRQWMARHTSGFDAIESHFGQIDIGAYARICGVDEGLLRATAKRIGEAASLSVFEDLGMQMSVHSTLGSWLQRLIWVSTGHYGREGTANAFVPFLSLAKASKGEATVKSGPRKQRVSPVVGAKIIVGLIPCNIIPDEILTDHPDRYRAMIVESGNPVHSLADSQRMRQALRALDFSVVIDVAMTETARQADWVLPAASQYEKAEATFFSTEFPDNFFHVRQPLFEPLEGTLTEAEIHTRLLEAMGVIGEKDYRLLRRALRLGRVAFTTAFFFKIATQPRLMNFIGPLLYRSLGESLPKGMAPAAIVFGFSLLFLRSYPQAAERAGFAGLLPLAVNKLFDAILSSPSGLVVAKSSHDESWQAIGLPEHRIAMDIPEMREAMAVLDGGLDRDPDFPLVLSAGERRSETANTAVRDASWHKKGIYAALRVSPDDASVIGCQTGDLVTLSTARASVEVAVEVSDMMRAGHISLPNGTGIEYRRADGTAQSLGVAPNELTDNARRDFLAGTPWHKHVPARVALARKQQAAA